MNKRQRQLSDVVQRCLSKITAEELEVAGMPGLTITGVDVSPDMCLAKVFFVPVFTSTIPLEDYLQQLNLLSSRMRQQLSRSANLRHTPQLRFLVDHGFVQGEEVDAIMRKLKIDDAED